MSSLEWMYEGKKSSVNREDYLLGKKLDKNFVDYSDVANVEKEIGIDAVVTSRTIKTEPSTSKVSGIEVDIIRTEDPLIAIKVEQEKIRQKRLENPLALLKRKKLLEKEMEKVLGNKNTKRKKKRDSSRKSRTRRHSSKHEDSSDDRDRREYNRSRQRYSHRHRHRSQEKKIYRKSSNDRSRNSQPGKDEDEILEKKRSEMMANAKWRNEIAESYSKLKADLDKKEEGDEKKAADFIRPMLNSATSTMSLKERINSKRQNLQRSHNYMDQK